MCRWNARTLASLVERIDIIFTHSLREQSKGDWPSRAGTLTRGVPYGAGDLPGHPGMDLAGGERGGRAHSHIHASWQECRLLLASGLACSDNQSGEDGSQEAVASGALSKQEERICRPGSERRPPPEAEALSADLVASDSMRGVAVTGCRGRAPRAGSGASIWHFFFPCCRRRACVRFICVKSCAYSPPALRSLPCTLGQFHWREDASYEPVWEKDQAQVELVFQHRDLGEHSVPADSPGIPIRRV